MTKCGIYFGLLIFLFTLETGSQDVYPKYLSQFMKFWPARGVDLNLDGSVNSLDVFLLTQYWHRSLSAMPENSLVVNASSFGAIENDTLSDMDAIQSAIDYVFKQGGGTVKLNAGTFLIQNRNTASEGSLEIKDNVSLVGAGIGITVLKLMDNLNKDINGLIRNSYLVNANSTIQDFTLDGNRQNNTGRVIGFFCGTSPDSLDTDVDIRCIRIEIQNCRDYGFDPHERTTRLYLIDCLAHDNGLDGFAIDYCNDSVLQGCKAWNNDRHGFNVITNSNYVNIIDCESYNNVSNGIMIQTGAENIMILNGRFHNNSGNGINVRGANHVWVEESTIQENKNEAINLQGSQYIIILNNQLNNNGLNGNLNDIELDKYEEQGSQFCIIYNNTIQSLDAIRTLYGVYEEDNLQDYNIVTQNSIEGQSIGSVFLSGPNSREVF